MESPEIPQTALQSWQVLSQWLALHWPWLCLLGFGLLIVKCWGWLVDWESGRRFWPLLAALLPPFIPLARDWEDHVPPSLKGCSVPALLLAVAVVQLYGQESNKRYRESADAEVRSISSGVRDLSSRVRDLSDGIRSVEIEREKQYAFLAKQYAFLAEQGAQLCSLADAIGSLADEIRSLKESEED